MLTSMHVIWSAIQNELIMVINNQACSSISCFYCSYMLKWYCTIHADCADLKKNISDSLLVYHTLIGSYWGLPHSVPYTTVLNI